MELYDYAVICIVLIVAVGFGCGIAAIIIACINDIVLADAQEDGAHSWTEGAGIIPPVAR